LVTWTGCHQLVLLTIRPTTGVTPPGVSLVRWTILTGIGWCLLPYARTVAGASVLNHHLAVLPDDKRRHLLHHQRVRREFGRL
jgi:hypothetical protein